MKDSIIKELILNHPIDTVWAAITKAEKISTWFINADFKAEIGYHYTFTAPEESGCTKITGEVKQADPYTLVYTWIVADTKVETTVAWTLTRTETGTKLHLEHSGITHYSGETAVGMFNSFNGGWDNCFEGLTKYLKELVHAG